MLYLGLLIAKNKRAMNRSQNCETGREFTFPHLRIETWGTRSFLMVERRRSNFARCPRSLRLGRRDDRDPVQHKCTIFDSTNVYVA